MVLRHGLPRALWLRPLRDRYQRWRVIRWLASAEGWAWARRSFDDVTACHEIIEIVDDSALMSEHRWRSSNATFRKEQKEAPEWADLTWNPDKSP